MASLNIYVGNDAQGAARKAALQRLAEAAGHASASAWLIALADAELASAGVPDGVPAFSQHLDPAWLAALPAAMLVWQMYDNFDTLLGYAASMERPERPGRALSPAAFTAAEWLDWIEERQG